MTTTMRGMTMTRATCSMPQSSRSSWILGLTEIRKGGQRDGRGRVWLTSGQGRIWDPASSIDGVCADSDAHFAGGCITVLDVVVSLTSFSCRLHKLCLSQYHRNSDMWVLHTYQTFTCSSSLAMVDFLSCIKAMLVIFSFCGTSLSSILSSTNSQRHLYFRSTD